MDGIVRCKVTIVKPTRYNKKKTVRKMSDSRLLKPANNSMKPGIFNKGICSQSVEKAARNHPLAFSEPDFYIPNNAFNSYLPPDYPPHDMSPVSPPVNHHSAANHQPRYPCEGGPAAYRHDSGSYHAVQSTSPPLRGSQATAPHPSISSPHVIPPPLQLSFNDHLSSIHESYNRTSAYNINHHSRHQSYHNSNNCNEETVSQSYTYPAEMPASPYVSPENNNSSGNYYFYAAAPNYGFSGGEPVLAAGGAAAAATAPPQAMAPTYVSNYEVGQHFSKFQSKPFNYELPMYT